MFQSSDIPFSDFQKLGKYKQEILNLPQKDLNILLSGRTTSLMDIKPEGGKITKAKLSIYQLDDGSMDIKVHPIKDQVELPQNLNKKQTDRLLQGEMIIVPESLQKGIKEKHIYQVDLETNEVIKTSVGNIRIPKFMEGNRVTKEQRQILLEGNPISLNGPDGSTHFMHIDITAQKGYKIYNKKEIKDLSKEKGNTQTQLAEKYNTKRKHHTPTDEETKRSVKAGLAGGSTSIAAQQSSKKGRKR